MQPQVRPAARPSRQSVPGCTHMETEAVYDKYRHCPNCRQPCDLGFVLECREDQLLAHPQEAFQARRTANGAAISPLRLKLSVFGLNESIIEQAERGLYTKAQIEKLIGQKLMVAQVVESTRRACRTFVHDTRTNKELTGTADDSNITANDASAESGVSSHPAGYNPTRPRCRFIGCHHCCRWLWCRAVTNLDSIQPNTPPPTWKDLKDLPTHDNHIVRNIGLHPNPTVTYHDIFHAPLANERPANNKIFPSTSTNSGSEHNTTTSATPTPSTSSLLTYRTTQTDISVLRSLRTPSRRFYALSNRTSSSIQYHFLTRPLFSRDGLRAGIKSLFKRIDKNKPTELESLTTTPVPALATSAITLPIPRSGTARPQTEDETIDDLDVGALRRVRRLKECAELARGDIAGGFEVGPRLSAAFRGRSVFPEDTSAGATNADALSMDYGSRGVERRLHEARCRDEVKTVMVGPRSDAVKDSREIEGEGDDVERDTIQATGGASSDGLSDGIKTSGMSRVSDPEVEGDGPTI
ncbi:hypothetical protein M011DRAFT_468875 [Sporormia fimetaria CBS 119925]|uniref:Uncharacterized protein n=1 Tax=Sporormia fimetaria CBS 119925 TaxID=1340428 RepID=A0A6A6V9M7_9PLEO|nr:hypothetical protein M011DRAFT_468875 [Sporormia fimetaria CBS 119925]